ncbi:MAG: pantetheine-phosphate adenylyltransferase [Cyanobacteria bacterium J06642_2]
MAIALYPGSFDPITLGHLDIIERACQLFEQVVVAILRNPSKQPLFSLKQRQHQIEIATKHLSNVRAISFTGLTVNCARASGASILIRGLRVMSDFEFELQMAHTNQSLAPQLETIFLATSHEYSFLSSSLVKEVARYGGPLDRMAPPNTITDLRALFPHNGKPNL